MEATDPLDRSIWHALTTRHAALAEGGSRARRYPASHAPFAATRDETAESLAALAGLIPAGTGAALFTLAPLAPPPGLVATTRATLQQMEARAVAAPADGPPPVELGPADAADMAALVALTRPGPFAARTPELGTYLGLREAGVLVAMAGERFRLDGATEISAVCTHPDHRGRGHARRLLATLAGRILARGERPFLHVFDTNAAAIAVYAAMGFATRRQLHLTVLQRG